MHTGFEEGSLRERRFFWGEEGKLPFGDVKPVGESRGEIQGLAGRTHRRAHPWLCSPKRLCSRNGG